MARPARGESLASGNRISATANQRRALELRKSGLGYQAIAERVGYKSASGAHKAVQVALKKMLQEPADELRHLEVTRLDALLAGLWDKASAGDTWAVDRVLRIMERRSALLGLDAPQRREITGEIIFHDLAQRAALAAGLEPALVIAEAERILAEATD